MVYARAANAISLRKINILDLSVSLYSNSKSCRQNLKGKKVEKEVAIIIQVP
jgi:hypothetical protein